MGDFNAIMGLHKKTCTTPFKTSLLIFKAWLIIVIFLNMDTQGTYFTWARRGACSYVESNINWIFCSKHSSDY